MKDLFAIDKEYIDDSIHDYIKLKSIKNIVERQDNNLVKTTYVKNNILGFRDS